MKLRHIYVLKGGLKKKWKSLGLFKQKSMLWYGIRADKEI